MFEYYLKWHTTLQGWGIDLGSIRKSVFIPKE